MSYHVKVEASPWELRTLTVHADLDVIIGLLIDDGDVAPAESTDDLHHGLDLMMVLRDGASDVLEPPLVTELGAGREKGYLDRGNGGGSR
ncbi:hypothetical protein J6590_080021 [Homalodisca vitripennis]|nr:hypothetical protein J6590_080021 [Homalodisca vitripennis]